MNWAGSYEASPSWRAPLQSSDPKILTSVIGPDETHLFTCPAGEHRNFLDCVKSRQAPVSDIEIGHRSTSTALLANIAYRTGHQLTWDRAAETITGDDEASKLLDRAYRAPWKL